MIKKNILAVAVMVALMAPGAFAASLSVVGAGDWTHQRGNTQISGASTHLGVGGGVLLDLPGMMTHLQIGALYLNRSLNITDPTTGISAQAGNHWLEVPVLVRFGLGEMVSFGVGGYVAEEMGDTNVSLAGLSTTMPYNGKKTDAGLAASIGFMIPLAPAVGIVLDGRYTYGLVSLDNGGQSVSHLDDLQALVGIRFHI